MKTAKIICLAVCIPLVSCTDQPQTAGLHNVPGSSAGTALPAPALTPAAVGTSSNATGVDSSGDLDQARGKYFALCTELQRIRSQPACQTLNHLIEPALLNSCFDDNHIDAPRVFEADISVAADAFLMVDGHYRSSISFHAGDARKQFTWTNVGTDGDSPRIIDAQRIALVNAANTEIPGKFELFINGQLVQVDGDGSLSALKSFFLQNGCRHSLADLTKIQSDGAASPPVPPKVSADLARQDIDKRIAALSAELSVDADRGCWANQAIDTMDLTISGQFYPSTGLKGAWNGDNEGKQCRDLYNDCNDVDAPWGISVTFGNGLIYQNPDVRGNLGKPITIFNFKGYKISELGVVQVKLTGRAWQKGVGDQNGWAQALNNLKIDNLRIAANGQEIFAWNYPDFALSSEQIPTLTPVTAIDLGTYTPFSALKAWKTCTQN